MNIRQLLELTINREASDLHLLAGFPPTLRINGELFPIQNVPELTSAEVEELILPIISPYQRGILAQNWELDFGFDFEEKARFRVNLYRQKGVLAAALRLIPRKLRTIEEIGLPPVVQKVTELKQGLVLVTGPTGHGKSTTLAAFINQINLTRPEHIITIEDPIEFVYPHSKSLVSQRELDSDTKSWTNALKSVLREDPDVVLVGEMRDLEAISSALTIAETGHLVFATLHTNSASQTVNRIIDVFPEAQQLQIRSQLASVIEAVISQRLVPTIGPGRTLAYEILFGVNALRSLIREGKSYLIDNLIQTSAEEGMVTLESSLAKLVKEGQITAETAENYSLRPQLMSRLLIGR